MEYANPHMAARTLCCSGILQVPNHQQAEDAAKEVKQIHVDKCPIAPPFLRNKQQQHHSFGNERSRKALLASCDKTPSRSRIRFRHGAELPTLLACSSLRLDAPLSKEHPQSNMDLGNLVSPASHGIPDIPAVVTTAAVGDTSSFLQAGSHQVPKLYTITMPNS